MIKVVISRSVRDRLLAYCRSELPYEACGFILGRSQPGQVEAHDYVAVTNRAADRLHRFDMDPAELVAILYRYPASELVGVFHSHPSSSLLPSAADRDTAWHTMPTYWIISPALEKDTCIAVYNKEDFSAIGEVCINDD